MIIVLFLVAIVCPLAGMFCAVAHFTMNRKAYSNAVLFGTACGWAIYGYISDEGNDIIRHMEYLKLYRDLPFWRCFDIRDGQVYIWDLWSWCIAKLGNPYLLQVSAAFVGYSIIAYIVFDYANNRRYNLTQYLPMLLISLTMVSPLDVTNGVRFANAVLICTIAVYGYYVKNVSKIKTLLLFIVAIFLHHASAAILIVWLAMPIIRKYPKLTVAAIVAILLSFTNYDRYLQAFSGGNSLLATLLADGMQSARNYRNTVASFHSLFVRYLQMLFSALVLIRGRIAFNAGRALKTDHSGRKIEVPNWCMPVWQLAGTVFAIGACLTITLGTNGNRYFIASMLLGLIPFMESQSLNRFLKQKKYFALDVLIVGCALVCCALYINDMNWGTGSVYSYFISLMSGAWSRMLLL